MNKQIEEIAKYCCYPCEMESNGECIEGNNPCKCHIALTTAEALYKAGYRKQEDVVEVVRCEDCKYFKMAGTTPRCNFYKGLATTVNPSADYCSYGERRAEQW